MESDCKKCYLRSNQVVNFDEIRLLTQYIPHKVVRLIGESECCTFDNKIMDLEGTVVYFDIIGFTSIVVNYLTSQKDIADLSSTLSEYYSVITETVRGFNGSIYQFAGDSILISFEKQDNETPEANFKRAFTAMLRTIELSDNYNSVTKDTNGFILRPKIGIGYGRYNQLLLGNKDFFVTPVLVGNAVSDAIYCESQCKKQELRISNKAYEYASKCNLGSCFEKDVENFIFTKVDDSYFDTIEYPDYYDVEELFEKPFFYNRLSAFLNPVIRHQIENSFQGFSGEYKDVTCLMIRFKGDFVDQLKTGDLKNIMPLLDSIYITINNKACKYGGYSMKPDFSDKGIVFPVIFGTPSAIENKEKNAILCSTEILKTSKEFKEIAAVKIGVVTGMVYAGEFGGILRKDYTTIGNSINFASRLMTSSIAKDNFSILMDEKTKEATKGLCITEEITGISCKGYDNLQTAYRFINLKEKNNFFVSTKKLIGRDKELSELEGYLQKAAQNNITSVAVTGDVGIGKTFLVETLLSQAKDRIADLQIYQATCYQYEQTTPFFCWGMLFKQLLQIPDDLQENIAEMLVRAFFVENFPEDTIWVPSICNMMGYNITETPEISELEAVAKQKALFEIISKVVLLFGQKPLVLIFENLQWCDIVSMQVLEYLLGHKNDTKILILLASRVSENSNKFIQSNNIPRISLSVLSESDSTILAETLLNLKEKNPVLTKKIVYSSDGNPFFIENIIGSLVERKTLIEDKEGFRYISKEITNIQNIEIPSSIQNIILSRLDSLKFEEQIVCKTASAIGRTFYSDCLRGILPSGISDTAVDNALLQFERHDIIKKKDDTDKEYIFNHVVTHDVIYETILDTTKKELNLMILSYLESKYNGKFFSVIEKLEYHAIEAKCYDKIFTYASMAADKAEKQAAPIDAITHYISAEGAWKKDDGKKDINSLYAIQIKLAEQYRLIGNYADAEKRFNEVILSCKDKRIYSNALRGLGRCYQERGDFEGSIDTLESALSSLGKRVPKAAIIVYLSIVKEALKQVINYGLRKGKVSQCKNDKLVKTQTESDILCILNKLYYFGLPEKIAWSSLVNFNIALHLSEEREHLCLACGDYAVSLSSAGLKKLGQIVFKKGLLLSKIISNQKTESIFKARYAYYFLFYNNPQKSISLLEEACSYFKKIYEQWELMTAGGALAQNYFLVGEFEKSKKAYLETEELAKQLHSPMHLGWAYNKVPFIDYITGKSSAENSISTLLEGIKLSRSINDNMTLCIHYGHLTYISYKEKNYLEALKYAEQTMEENRIYKINVPHVKISYINVVEAVYYSLINNAIPSKQKGYYIKLARKALKKSLQLSKKYLMLEGPSLKAQSMINLIDGKETEALRSFQKATTVLSESPYKWEYQNLLEFDKENKFVK